MPLAVAPPVGRTGEHAGATGTPPALSSPCPGRPTSGASCSSSSTGGRTGHGAGRRPGRGGRRSRRLRPLRQDRHPPRRRSAPHRRRRRRHRPGLLSDEHIDVTARDIVAPGLTTQVKDGEQVVVRFARPFTVDVDGVTHTYWTTALTVDDALAAVGIRADGARLSAPAPCRWAARVSTWPSRRRRASRSPPTARRTVTTTAATVQDLLAEQGVALDGDDRLSVAATTAVTDHLAVTLTRSATVAAPWSRSCRSRRPRSAARPSTPGRPRSSPRAGRRRRAVYDLLLADGRLTTKSLVSATVTTAPVTRVVQVGTKAKPVAPAPSPERWRWRRGQRRRRRRRPQLGRARQVRVGRQPARGQPRRLLRPVPVQPVDLGLRRRQRQPDQRVAGGAAVPRQAALQAGRCRAVGLRERTSSTDRPVRT